MTEILTFEVFNNDGSITLEKTKMLELPKFSSLEDFTHFLNCAFIEELVLDEYEHITDSTIEYDYVLDGHHDHHFQF
jgi:hypothetical protein